MSRYSKFDIRNSWIGFTLLELLVVISIIGILVAISAVSFSTAQRQSRDSRRRQDIKSIQNAFEQYNSSHGGVYNAISCDSMVTGNITGPVPSDPQTGATYTGTAVCKVDAYCVCAKLEVTGSGNATDVCPASAVPLYSSGLGTEDYWCASNLQ